VTKPSPKPRPKAPACSQHRPAIGGTRSVAGDGLREGEIEDEEPGGAVRVSGRLVIAALLFGWLLLAALFWLFFVVPANRA
jgi:hypothetical protein